MKSSRAIILTIITMLALVAMLAWWYSDSQVVERRSKAFAKSLTVATSDGKTARSLKNQNFSELLADNMTCTVELSAYSSDFRHDELVSAHHILVHNCGSSSVEITRIQVTTHGDNTATVNAGLVISVKEKDGTPHAEACEAVLIWKKSSSGVWQIDSLSVTSLEND